jgi:hypothetical protein
MFHFLTWRNFIFMHKVLKIYLYLTEIKTRIEKNYVTNYLIISLGLIYVYILFLIFGLYSCKFSCNVR